MMRALGLCVGILTAVVMVINAGFMLASPRAWFRLPAWLRAQGSLTEDKFSTGWGAIQIRLLGALILGTIVWVVYDFLLA